MGVLREIGHDSKTRMMMFYCLVKSMMIYEAEIWGGKEQDKRDKGILGGCLYWIDISGVHSERRM